MDTVVLCGVSARVAAASAARAGFRVTAIDAYADVDQHPSVRALSMRRDFTAPATAAAMARAARDIRADAAVYLSPFENHPHAVRTLATGRALWGNPPEVLRRVRDPLVLAETFRRHGFAVPATRGHNTNAATANDPDPNHWLLKPLRSGGGHRVRCWQGQRVGPGAYLQELIDGTPGSVLFVAARGEAVPIGVSRQLIGDPHFGAEGYRYCGNIVAPASDPQFAGGPRLFEMACALARVAAAEFALVGVNGIDFVARDGVAVPIELNPRWSASLEIIEPRTGWPLFGAHAAACVDAALPAVTAAAVAGAGHAVGKAVVFARRDAAAVDTHSWLDDPSVRDVPHPGETFKAGEPVCTVLATAADAEQCYQALVARAERIYVQLEDALTGPAGLVDSVRA